MRSTYRNPCMLRNQNIMHLDIVKEDAMRRAITLAMLTIVNVGRNNQRAWRRMYLRGVKRKRATT